MAWLPDEIHDFYEDCKDKKSTAQSARHARTHCGKGGRVKFASDYMTKKEREAMNGECKSYRMNDPISWEEFKTWPSEHKITYIKLLRNKYNVPDKYIAEMMGISRPCLCKVIVDLGIGLGKQHGQAHKKNSWDKEGFYAWWHGAKGDVVKPSETPVEEDNDDAVRTCEEHDEGSAAESVNESITEATDELVAVNEEPEIEVDFDNNNLLREVNEILQGASDILEEAKRETEKSCSYTTDCREKMIRDAGPIAFTGNSMPVIPSRGTLTFDNNAADDVLSTIKTLLSNMRVSMTITWSPAE